MTGIALGAAVLGGAALGFVTTVGLGAVLLAWSTGTGARPGVRVVAAVVAAAALGAWRGVEPPRAQSVDWADRVVGVAGRVASIPAATGQSQRFLLDVAAVWDGEERFPAGGRVDVTGPLLPRVEVGDRVWVSGVVTPLIDHHPGYAAYLRTLDCGGSLLGAFLEVDAASTDPRRHAAAFRMRIDDVFLRAAPGDAGALLAGLVTGADHAMSRTRRQAFVRTGTSHLTAVSGSNVALLVTLALLGASGTRRRRVAWQVGIVAGVWTYAALVGLMPPATRAALVATGAVFAVRAGRRPDLLTLLVLSAALMVAAVPAVLWSLSFQLSFAASLGLAAVAGAGAPVGWLGWLRLALLSTVAAQVATLPLQVAAFGDVSLVAVPANLLLAPLTLLAFPLGLGAAAVGVAAAPVGEAIAAVGALPVGGMLAVVDALDGAGSAWPFAPPGPVGSALLTAVCAGALCLAGREGRVWLGRTVADARQARWRLPATIGAVAVLASAFVAVALVVR